MMTYFFSCFLCWPQSAGGSAGAGGRVWPRSMSGPQLHRTVNCPPRGLLSQLLFSMAGASQEQKLQDALEADAQKCPMSFLLRAVVKASQRAGSDRRAG